MKSKRAQEAVTAADDKPAELHDNATPPTKKRKRSGEDDVADSGKKDKKDKKKKKKSNEPETRKEKKDKRKDLQDLPGEDDSDVNGDDAAATVEKVEKKEKKEKKSKKDKKQSEDSSETLNKKSKKEKKAATTGSDETATATIAQEDAIPNGASNGIDLDVDEEENANGEADETAASGKPEKASRHIVFVGNLPFTATAATISAHFASLSPIAVRCLTNKGDTKNTCKGIAFVEFANVWTQRTCLDRFHHSEFNDGKSAPRKINVELSAGGGGNSSSRKEKIMQKNIKLDENRAKRIDKEKEEKAAGKTDGTVEEQQQHMDEQIHPSRRAQMGSGDAPEEDNYNNNRNGYGGGRRGGGGGGRGGGGRGRGGRGRGGGGGRGRGGYGR